MRTILRLLGGWVLISFISLVYLQPWSWTWHPRSTLGWIVVFLLVAPLLTLLAEYLIQHVVLESPIAARLDALGPGAGASALRITYVLICVGVVGAVGILAFGWLSRTGWLGAL